MSMIFNDLKEQHKERERDFKPVYSLSKCLTSKLSRVLIVVSDLYEDKTRNVS